LKSDWGDWLKDHRPKLLIAPEGIEIFHNDHAKYIEDFLLIAPEGIEIVPSIVNLIESMSS